MKIKTVQMPYEQVMKKQKAAHFYPKKPNILFRAIIRAAASGDLKQTHFSYSADLPEGMLDTPCLILMNHSSFIDLEIVSKIMFPRPYTIVCTSDGFVGKPWLMRQIGCIPTKKFVSDVTLIGDMEYSLKELKTSVLMYPEASYSFDGRATPLRRKLGVLLKRLGVPVIYIQTFGAFARDPLYNCLQKRKVDVSASVKCLFTAEEVKNSSVAEIDKKLNDAFSFDNFKWQKENGVEITEPFRADGLDRILYKCAHCGAEGATEGKGIGFTCKACGKIYRLNTLGELEAAPGDSEFPHIPDWYAWERAEVKKEIEEGTYLLDTEVNIGIMVDYKAIYMVGEGRLIHNSEGFALTGCDGQLEYRQSPTASYSLYSDYYWYEIDDVICIGNNDILYYCFPKKKNVAAKTRLAAEEMYKMNKKIRPRDRIEGEN